MLFHTNDNTVDWNVKPKTVSLVKIRQFQEEIKDLTPIGKVILIYDIDGNIYGKWENDIWHGENEPLMPIEWFEGHS